MKRTASRSRRTPTPKVVPAPIASAQHGQLDAEAARRAKETRNKANTRRNAAKVEHYLMEIEKAHGFAKSWALRERLEQGEISLEELMRR